LGKPALFAQTDGAFDRRPGKGRQPFWWELLSFFDSVFFLNGAFEEICDLF
jgi:hypothetical protein